MPSPYSNFVLGTCKDDLLNWFDPVINSGELLTWDLESNHAQIWLDSYFLTVFSFFSKAAKKPLIVLTPQYTLGSHLLPDNYGRKYESDVVPVLQTILQHADTPKCGHNVKFDENAIFKTFGFTPKGFFGDTMIMRYCLDPKTVGRLGLDDCIIEYFPEVEPYWLNLEVPKDDYSLIPPERLLPYAAYDTFYTDKLFYRLYDELEAAGPGTFVRLDEDGAPLHTQTYGPLEYNFHVRRCHHLIGGHMERVGVPVDTELVSAMGGFYEAVMLEKETALRTNEKLVEFERTELINVLSKDRYNKHVRALYGKIGGKPRTPLKRVQLELENYNGEVKFGDDEKFPRINWKSLNESRAFFIDFLGLEPYKFTDAGAPSLDEEAMQFWAGLGHEEAKVLMEFRGAEKFVSSYIKPLTVTDDEDRYLFSDGKLHANISVAGIKTGRISIKRPPLQALPRDGMVKRLYISRFPGGLVTQRDYSGLEVRILALAARDPSLITAFREGRDPHFNTQRHFFKDAADKGNKSQRSVCKQALFGRVYGQGDKGLHELLAKQGVKSPNTGIAVSLDECKEFNIMIDEAYPFVPAWVGAAHAAGIKHLRCTSAFGFSAPLDMLRFWPRWKKNRSIPEGAEVAAALRHSQNYPIQGTASDLTILAAYRIQQTFEQRGMQSLVMLIVHDAIYVDTHPDEVAAVSGIMATIMDNSTDWLEDLLPGYDCSWIDLPIIGENEVGINAKDAYVAVKEPTMDDPRDEDLILKLPEFKEGDNRAVQLKDLFGDAKQVSWKDGSQELLTFLRNQRLVFY